MTIICSNERFNGNVSRWYRSRLTGLGWRARSKEGVWLRWLTTFRGSVVPGRGGVKRDEARFEVRDSRRAYLERSERGQVFHPVFVLGTFLLLHVGQLAGGRFLVAGLCRRSGSPSRSSWSSSATISPSSYAGRCGASWSAFVILFRFVDLGALVLVFGLYVFFTVFFWGTLYYHLRTGAPRTNFIRFWRLVLENPDSTSGNFLEQVPKALLALSPWSTSSPRR